MADGEGESHCVYLSAYERMGVFYHGVRASHFSAVTYKSAPRGAGECSERVAVSGLCASWRGAHCVYLSAYELSFYIPGSAFAALTAAGLPTNLPLAGQGYG
jgi:hypothetical protein